MIAEILRDASRVKDLSEHRRDFRAIAERHLRDLTLDRPMSQVESQVELLLSWYDNLNHETRRCLVGKTDEAAS